MIGRYQLYVKEHQDFNANYATLMGRIDDLSSQLDECREIVGDYKILQDRRGRLEQLNDIRTELDKSADALADLGERLYVHTAPDGREMLRVQLKVTRERWEALSDDMVAAANQLDQCLQQFAEFSASQVFHLFTLQLLMINIQHLTGCLHSNISGIVVQNQPASINN